MPRTRGTIGVVTSSYPAREGDAAGWFVAAQVRALREVGWDVEVIACGEGDQVGAAGESVTWIGSALHAGGGAIDRLEAGGSWRAAVGVTARMTALVATRSRRWDKTIAHWLAPSGVAMLAAARPTLAIAHGGDVHVLARRRMLGAVTTGLVMRGVRVWFVSEELRAMARASVARWARGAFEERSVVQAMGVERAGTVGDTPTTETSTPIVLVIARLVPVKGVAVAIEAIEHVDGAELVVLGDGPLRGALEARAGARVRFVGQVDAQARDAWLARARVVVVPSIRLENGRSEGMPLVAGEALAAGVPLVVSAVGGLRDLAAPVRQVAPGDPLALARAIREVVAAPPSREALRAAFAPLDQAAALARLHRDLEMAPGRAG